MKIATSSTETVEISQQLKSSDFPIFRTVTVVDANHKLAGRRGKVRDNSLNVSVEFENIKNRAGNPKPVSFKPEQLRLEPAPTTWVHPPVPWDKKNNAESQSRPQEPTFEELFRKECVEGSGIDPELYKAAIEIISDVGMRDGGDAYLPIHEALGWNQEKFTRFGQQCRPTLFAAAFKNEDGTIWQCKLSDPLKNPDGTIRRYETPTADVGGGSRAYLPPVPKSIREKIAHRWGVAVPMEGSFWQWVLKSKLIPIVVTEGGKKTLALLSQGIVAIGFYGCWNGTVNKDISGRSTVPELIADFKPFAIAGRTFYIAMDRDSKPQAIKDVTMATNRLGACLEKAGCSVRVCQWEPKQGKGIDDYLVSGGDIDALLTNAPVTSFEGKEFKSKNKQLLSFFEKEFGDRLRLNEMTLRIELDGQPKDLDTFFLDLADLYDLDIYESRAVKLAVYIARKNAYSPVRDYLNSLQPEDPAFLDTLAARYLANDDPIAAKLLKRTLIAACARAYEPGCKHDAITIFQAKEQGLFKSTFWNTLAGDDFFTDSIGSDLNPNDEKLKLRSYWILEYSEFENAYKRKEIEQVKAFITSRIDSMRVSYDRELSKFPRTSILVGTTNQEEFLRDSTGERRFWVIPIRCRINVEQLQAERDRIWAAARSAYLAGDRWWLTPEEEKELGEYTTRFKEYDPWQEDIAAFLEIRDRVSMGEVLNALGVQTHTRDKRATGRIVSILRGFGWEPDRDESGSKRIWKKKSNFNVRSVRENTELSQGKGLASDIDYSSNVRAMSKAATENSKSDTSDIDPSTNVRRCTPCEEGDSSVEDSLTLKTEKNKNKNTEDLQDPNGQLLPIGTWIKTTSGQIAKCTIHYPHGGGFSRSDGTLIGYLDPIDYEIIDTPPTWELKGIKAGSRVKYSAEAITRQQESITRFEQGGKPWPTPWAAEWEYRVDEIDGDGTCHLSRLGGGKGKRSSRMNALWLVPVK